MLEPGEVPHLNNFHCWSLRGLLAAAWERRFFQQSSTFFTFQSIQMQSVRGLPGCPSPDHTAHSKHGQCTSTSTANSPGNLASNYWAWGVSKRVMFENCPSNTGFCQRTASARTSVRETLHIFLPPLLVEDCLWYACREYAPHL